MNLLSFVMANLGLRIMGKDICFDGVFGVGEQARRSGDKLYGLGCSFYCSLFFFLMVFAFSSLSLLSFLYFLSYFSFLSSSSSSSLSLSIPSLPRLSSLPPVQFFPFFLTIEPSTFTLEGYNIQRTAMALQIHLLPDDDQPYQTPPPPTLTNSKSHHCRPSSLASTRSKPFLSLFLLILTHIILSVLLFCTTPTTAQAPTPRRRTAYAQTPNNTRLYIQGGLPIGTGYTPEFNELDLTKPWPTSAPAWSLLPPGLPNYRHAMVYVKPEHSAGLGGASAGSQGYLLSIGGNTVPGINFWAYYNIQTQQWTPITTPTAPYPGLEGPTAVSDPNTGLVYVIGGFWNLDGTLATTLKITNFMTVIDPTQSIGTRIVSQTPATGLNNLTGAVAVWSTMRRSVLVFGGSRAVALADIAGLQMTSIDEYDPVRGTWGTMVCHVFVFVFVFGCYASTGSPFCPSFILR